MMIRPATIADLAAIVAIYNDAVADRFATADTSPVTLEQRRPWFEEHDTEHPICVLESEGAVRGWYSLSAYRSGRAAVRATAELSYYVSSDARGRGFGTALITHAISEARRLGMRVLFCIILERNAASVGLMRKCGFELWGRLPDVASIDGELVSHVYYGRKL
jgi:L-amino acid N-acyltransferase YncA